MHCKNCNQPVENKFCSYCGQKTSVRKIDSTYIFKEVPNSILQMDHGFFFTVKELFTRPGHAIRNFIQGKRKPYYKPFPFLLVTTGILAVVMGLENYLFNTFDKIFKDDQENIDGNLRKLLNGLEWMTENPISLTLILLVISSITSYLCFRKSKSNFYEIIVLNVYITSVYSILFSIDHFIRIFLKSSSILVGSYLSQITYRLCSLHLS